jgi:hypothetical protein
VQAEGVVELEFESRTEVPVPLADNGKAVLTELYIKDGERVREGQRLAKFSNRDYEADMRTAEKERNAYARKLDLLRQEPNRAAVQEEITRTEQAQGQADARYRDLHRFLAKHSVVVAPRSGIIMSPPSIDDAGKRWDKKQLLCMIGEPQDSVDGERKLRVLIPVTPSNYNLLQQDMGGLSKDVALQVSIRVHGMGRQTWRGLLRDLPKAEAATIPPLLSNKTGGPVAVKPGTHPDQLIPQTQQYLVAIELVEPDIDMHPGVRAKVKIHCRKRPLSWWVWRSVNDLFNLGLM